MSSRIEAIKLRKTLESMRAGLNVDVMLFTSFEIDPAFFEQNVLLDLVEGFERYQTVEEIETIEQACDDHGVVVFHDFARAQRASEKTIDFNSVPIHVDGGVFHPKVVLVSGYDEDEESADRQVRLMVSSANLTYAGWGSNLEAGGSVDIRDTRQASSLSVLVSWLRERAEEVLGEATIVGRLSEVLDRLAEIAEQNSETESPLVHVTLPGHSHPDAATGLRPLMYVLSNERTGPLIMVSPFFSGTQFFDDVERAFDGREITVAPGRIEGDTVHLDEDMVRYLESSSLQLARLEQPGDDDLDRRQHLKCFEHDAGVVIGSHNASFNALGFPLQDGAAPSNVEVSLEWPGASVGSLITPVDDGVLKPSEEGTSPPESIDVSGGVPLVALTVDWEERRIELVVIAGDEDEYGSFGLSFPSTDVISLQAFDIRDARGQLSLDRVDAKSLAESKKFELYRLGTPPTLKYVGYVNERNRDARDRRREPSIIGCLQAWCSLDQGDPRDSPDAESVLHRKSLADREARLVGGLLRRRQGRLENYFYIFRAASKMASYLMSAKDEPRLLEHRVYTVLRDSSGSIQHMLEHIDELAAREDADEEADETTYWLEQPIPRGLLARELAMVLDTIEELAPEVRADTVHEFRNRLEELGSDFERLVSNLDDDRIDFLTEELARGEAP